MCLAGCIRRTMLICFGCAAYSIHSYSMNWYACAVWALSTVYMRLWESTSYGLASKTQWKCREGDLCPAFVLRLHRLLLREPALVCRRFFLLLSSRFETNATVIRIVRYTEAASRALTQKSHRHMGIAGVSGFFFVLSSSFIYACAPHLCKWFFGHTWTPVLCTLCIDI